MPNNRSVIDIKSNNLKVVDIIPNNSQVIDTKPNLSIAFGETAVYTEILLSNGMWMGFGALTYPEDIYHTRP